LFEQCCVPNLNPNSLEKPCFNLLFDSITSADAIGHLLSNIRDNDPAFWAELSQADVNVNKPPPATFDEPLFGKDVDNKVDDTSAHPSVLINMLLAGDQTQAPVTDLVDHGGLADNLNLDVNNDLKKIALAVVSGCDCGPGKRVVKPQRLYQMDGYDRKAGSSGAKAQSTQLRKGKK
jgi:hypothetical protein